MPSNQNQAAGNKYLIPLTLVTSLFFLWAFLHNINPVLIPHLKKACQLSDTQSALIDSAVYFGYFLIALPAGFFMHKFGYKNGILFGLVLYGLGSILFVPAASSRDYNFFLVALFIAASGATFLETVANPYAAKLGPKETSEQRLNLVQSFNGLGAVVAPIVGGHFILSGIEHTPEELSAMSSAELSTYLDYEAGLVKMPYIVIASIVFVVLVLFFMTKLPEIKEEDAAEEKKTFSIRVFRHSHVSWAVIAQFFYIGAQVGVGSFIVRFSKYVMNMPEKQAVYLWGSIAMVGFMIGRFTGTYFMKFIKPARLLAIYSACSVALLLVAILATGPVAVYAVMGVPFFMSIMFPTIFALGIKGLGEESKIASSFLIMSIVGGAFAPILMGYISDRSGSMQNAYIVPLICFAVVFYFGWRGHRIKPLQTK